MSESETRMSRYHRQQRRHQEYEDYVKGTSSDGQTDQKGLSTGISDTERLNQEETMVYHPMDWWSEEGIDEAELAPDLPWQHHTDSQWVSDSEDQWLVDSIDGEAPLVEGKVSEHAFAPSSDKGPYHRGLDRFLNNALILVTVLLLTVIVMMFIF